MTTRWPAPTRRDHLKFCEVDNWVARGSATSTRGTDHLYFELALADGRILRTKISHPPGRIDYGPALWSRILKDQLEVSEEEFWNAVRDSVRPVRSQPDVQDRRGIPLGVAHKLSTLVGLSAEELSTTTPEEAIERLNAFWAERRD